MLSRVAESIYWTSRYLERAENVARFVDVNYNLTLGDNSSLSEQWSPLIYTTGDHEDFKARYDEPSRRNTLQFLLFDAENPNSILSCINKARESARTIREVIPSSIWEHLNRFRMLVGSAAKTGEAFEQPYDFCESVRTNSQLMAGISLTSMMRDESWLFSQLGRHIERADKTSRIVDVQYFLLLPKVQDVGTSVDIVRWSSLLRSADALDMYRRTHGRIVPKKVAQFLILEAKFPRSIRFCIDQAFHSLQKLHHADSRDQLPSINLIQQLVSRLDTISIEEIIEQGMHHFIDQLQGALNGLGNSFHGDFFNTQDQFRRFVAQSKSQSMDGAMQQQS